VGYTSLKYFTYADFISTDECDTLASWIIENQQTDFFVQALHPGTIRKTTRFSKDVVYPDIAYAVQDKIDILVKELFKLDDITRVPVFPKGMCASIGTQDDRCQSHKDPRYLPNHFTYHFNIILSEHENADLYIENNLVKLSKSDGILYPVSELEHYTTKLTDTTPRLFWSFGYCIPV
jgi:hypothetical protein